MCSRDYFEYIEPAYRSRLSSDHRLVCPEKLKKQQQVFDNQVEVLRLKRENERLLAILENVSQGAKPPTRKTQ